MKENSEGGGGQGGCEHEDLNYCDSAKKLGGGKRTLSLLQNMSEKIKIFKRQLLKKSYRFFFQLSPDHLLIVSYKLIKASSLYLLYFLRYHICKITEYKI